MWYGHHPFFLFLIPGLINERLERKHAQKEIQEEQAIQKELKLRGTNEQDVKSRLRKCRVYHEQKSKEAMPDFRKLGISTFFFFICLLVEEGSIVLIIFLLPSIIGMIIFGIKSLCHYSELERVSDSIWQLENELKRRTKG
jgi:hypothetical protein